VIDDHRDLGIRAEPQEFRLVLLALPDIDRDQLVGEAQFLERNEIFCTFGLVNA